MVPAGGAAPTLRLDSPVCPSNSTAPRCPTACGCWSSPIPSPRSSASRCTSTSGSGPSREGRTGFAHLFEHLMFQGSESLEKLAHFRLRAELRRGLQRLHPPGLHRLLRGAAGRGAGARAVPGGRPAARAQADHREPAQPGGRGQGGDPAQRAEPALRRVPLDPAAAGALRHLPQRAQRLRRLLRAGAGLARRRRRVLRHLLRPGQRAGHGGRLPRRRRDAGGWSRSTSATSRRRGTPARPSFAEPPPGAERRRGGARPARPAARAGARLPDAGPGRRPRRLPRLRAAGLGARRRRGGPAAAAAGARGRASSPTSRPAPG